MAQSSDLSLEEKHAAVSHCSNYIQCFTLSLQVQKWLSSVFTRIPDYPVNECSIDLFYDAAIEAKQYEKRSQLVAQGYKQRAEEYKTEGFLCYVLRMHLVVCDVIQP